MGKINNFKSSHKTGKFIKQLYNFLKYIKNDKNSFINIKK